MRYPGLGILLLPLLFLGGGAQAADQNRGWPAITELERSYRILSDQLPAEKQVQLAEAQQAWRAYRDQTCALEKELQPILGDADGIQALQEQRQAECLQRLNRQRQAALKRYLVGLAFPQQVRPGIAASDDPSLLINDAELIFSQDIALTIWSSSYLDENQKPGDFRDEFILGTHACAYISTRFFNLSGKHRVGLKWYRPGSGTTNEMSVEHRFTQENTRLWHRIELDENMPPGAWLLEILLDDKLLTTKKITLLPADQAS